MFYILDRTESSVPVDKFERIGTLLLKPVIYAFGRKAIIQKDFEGYHLETSSKIQRVMSIIFYTLLFPITVPATLLGLLMIQSSHSSDEACKMIFNSLLKNKKELFEARMPINPSAPPEISLESKQEKDAAATKAASLVLPSRNPFANKAQRSQIPFKWPADLALLGLKEEGRKVLENFIATLMPLLDQPEFRPLTWEKKGSFNIVKLSSRIWRLPVKVFVLGNPGQRRLFLNLKTKLAPAAFLAQGSTHVIKKCYDPIQGEFIVKKRIANKLEFEWIQLFSNNTGVVSNLALQRFTQTDNEGKVILTKDLAFEPLYDGTLRQLLLSDYPLSLKQKLNIIKNALIGLHVFHRTFSIYSIPENLTFLRQNKKIDEIDFDTFHNDIKPENILFKRNQNIFEIGITDFDLVNEIENVSGTRWYRSPELIDFWMNKPVIVNEHKLIATDLSDMILFNIWTGQKRDVWAMGLVISEILMKKNSLRQNPKKMKWIQAAEAVATLDDFPDHWITTSCQQIENEIEQRQTKIRKNSPGEALILLQLWDIVKGMLRIQPEERLSAAEALNIIERIETLV